MYCSLILEGVKRLSALAIVFVLSACAENPLLKSDMASHTDGVVSIEQALDKVITEDGRISDRPEATAVLPEPVMNALMPGMAMPGGMDSEERFDLVVDGLNVAEFFRGLVKGTNYNVIVHPSVAGSITLELNQVTVPEVLEIVSDNYGIEYKQEGRLIKVLPGGLRTEIYQINYLNVTRDGGSETQVSSGQVSSTRSSATSSTDTSTDAGRSAVGTHIKTTSKSDFWSQLVSTLQLIIGEGEGRTVVATPNAGIVVVKAEPNELRAVKQYLNQAELIMQRQVILEAKIMEVSLSEGFEQGIQWNNIAQFGDDFDAQGNTTKYTTSNLSTRDILEEPINKVIGGVFSATLNVKDFSTVIQLLGLQGNVQVLSSPRISTVNNQKAVIKVGSDEFFVTDIDIDNDADTGDSSTDIELTPFFSGISLDVTPQISEDGTIILHVHPSISDVEDQSKVISLGSTSLTLPLAFSTIRETDSIISARNGQIVVIGGLIQNINQEQQAATPILSEIPWLGEAFKQKSQSARKVELVILLRPIITTRESTSGDIRDTRDRFRQMQDTLTSPYRRPYY